MFNSISVGRQVVNTAKVSANPNSALPVVVNRIYILVAQAAGVAGVVNPLDYSCCFLHQVQTIIRPDKQFVFLVAIDGSDFGNVWRTVAIKKAGKSLRLFVHFK